MGCSWFALLLFLSRVFFLSWSPFVVWSCGSFRIRLGCRPERPRCVGESLRDECTQASLHRPRQRRTASDCVAVPNAHAVLARACAMNAPRRRCTALANAANSTASDCVAVPKAHAVLARFCALNAPRHRSIALAKAANSTASDRVAVPNAHVVLASSCAMNLPMCRFANMNIVLNNVADLTHKMVRAAP